tara:strand:- start:53 stop:427 length:375 start_codon:yes stop_codon:yes gene_type:complete
MAITINSTTEHTDYKIAYYSIEYDGKTYKWLGKMPLEADPQAYWDAKEERIQLSILRREYKEAVVPQLEGKSELESFEAWVSTGCRNEDGEVIEKKTWVDIEPPTDTAALIAKLQAKVTALENA